MKRQLIKLIPILLTLAVWMPVHAHAAEPVAGGSYNTTMVWTLDADGTLTIRGTGAIDDYQKGALTQPWIPYRSRITALIVEDGITRIGDRAFQSCKYMERAVIGQDVASIGEWAFQNCYALTSVTLSPEVTIENGAFRGTPAETDIRAVESPLYTASPYYAALSQVDPNRPYRETIIQIALSQVGYHEGDSKADYAGDNANGSDNYTEYGRYLNSQGRAWCSEFAVWCIRMAGVPRQIVADSCSANASTFTKDASAVCYSWDQTVWGGGSYTPRKGDLLLWAWDLDSHDTDEDLSHTSLLTEHNTQIDGIVVLNTIDGNSDDQVKPCIYKVDAADGTLKDRTGHLCYIIAPDYEHTGTKTARVRFSAGGSLAAEKLVAENGLYGVLPVPSGTDDSFLGWYTDRVGGTRVNPYTPVRTTEDHTLYARWASGDGCSYGKLGENKELSWVFDRVSGLITVTGTIDTRTPVYVAGYEADGRMRSIDVIDCDGGQVTVKNVCTHIRLFRLDHHGLPMCSPVLLTQTIF